MNIIEVRNYQELSEKASQAVIDQLYDKPDSVLGLSTGSTPMGMYQELIKAFKENKVDFSRATFFNLDEYLGLEPDNVNSYSYYMQKNFFNQIKVDQSRINIPNGMAEDLTKESEDYEEKIELAKGIDLQILGIGENGHLAFNEPGSFFKSRTRIVDLSEHTKIVNARHFKNSYEVPEKAITMGLGTIMQAKKILLLASGVKKAQAVRRMIMKPVTADLPASILQKHKGVTAIIDNEAGEKM